MVPASVAEYRSTPFAAQRTSGNAFLLARRAIMMSVNGTLGYQLANGQPRRHSRQSLLSSSLTSNRRENPHPVSANLDR